MLHFFQILIGLKNALEAAASSKSLVDKISLGVEVGLITNQLADNLAASVLVQDIMDSMELLVKGIPQFRQDKRREIPSVTQLRYNLIDNTQGSHSNCSVNVQFLYQGFSGQPH